MANTKSNTIKVTFKKEELPYATTFKEMYSTPSAILKDFIIEKVDEYLSSSNKPIQKVNVKQNDSINIIDF